MRKRFFSLLLALCMMLSLLPSVAMAEGEVTLYVSSSAANDSAVRAEGAEYKTVKGAYTKAQSGDTIKLKSDITTPSSEARAFTTANKSIIFDFNGYTMNCSYNANTVYGLYISGANSVLTVTDSSIEKTGKMVMLSTEDGKFLNTGIAASGGGKVVVEYCTIVAPEAAKLSTHKSFFALASFSTAEVIGTLNVIGDWSEESLALGGNLYAIRSSGTGAAAYVRDDAVVSASGSVIQGANAPVWFTSSSAKRLVCKGTNGTVAIPLTENMTLTKDLDNGMLSFRVPSASDVTLDLNGNDLSCQQINIVVGANAKLHITNGDNAESRITNNGTSAHNIVNYGDLIIDGKVKIINRSDSSVHACIYQEGDSYPLAVRPANYTPTIATSVLGEEVILDANYAAMYVDYSYRETSSITINGSTLSSQRVSPLQVPNGMVTVNGATFVAALDDLLTTRVEGFFAGTNTRFVIDLTKYKYHWLENVWLNAFHDVNITARDNGIYLDERLQNGDNATASFTFSDITVNKNAEKPAQTGIMNLSGKNITLSGKDTYFVCDTLYVTSDSYTWDSDGDGHNDVVLGFADPAGALTVIGGVYSVDPAAYVPDTDGVKDYAILSYDDAVVTNGFLVAPWTKVGADNTVSLYYAASATDTTTASDDVSILALGDTEGVVSDPTMVQAKHFTLSSAADSFVAIDGLTVTSFQNGNRLTVQKTKACTATEAYVWYGGRSVGKIIFEVKNEPTYDVGGEITGADGKPTAYLIRNGVRYDATVTGETNPYEYLVKDVPSGTYNLVVSSAVTGGSDNTITTTVLVDIINHSIAQNVVLPSSIYNSVVTTEGTKTPNVEAGGLDDIAKTVGAPDANTFVLIELKVSENESSDNADDVKTAITEDGMVKGIIMDTDVLKTVNEEEPVKITEIDPTDHGISLITVVFHLPENLQGKDGYAIFRYHGTQVDKITEIPNANGEYMTVNADKDTITARLCKFSTYSIAYAENPTVTFDPNGGSVTPTSAKTNADSKLDSLPTPTRSGSYRFDGWYTAATGGTEVTTDTVFASDSTIYAHWTYTGGDSSYDYYTITATVGIGGAISPAGNLSVREGSDKRFTITAASGYQIAAVKVDGVSVGAVSSYTFADVRANHTIEAVFQATDRPTLNTADHFAYMQGYNTGAFSPDGNMTRAEAVVMFSRLLTEQMDVDKTYSSSFSDISGTEWYANAVGYMERFGIISGYTDGTFGGNKHITRAEFAVIASRFDALLPDSENTFSDVSDNYWARDYIVSAASKGWVTGYSDGSFRPESGITRAEVVTIVNRMLNRQCDMAFVSNNADKIKSYTDLTPAHWAYGQICEASNAHDYTKNASGEVWTALQSSN